jgi:hypothetical protein
MLRIKTVFFSLFLFAFLMNAQYSTSPYSYFGVGEHIKKGFGQSRAMGNIGYGVRTYNQINYLNPASYTAQDTQSFMLDVSLLGNYTNYTSSEGEALSRNLTLNTITIAFPVLHEWKASLGLLPYSRVGYYIVEDRQEVDTSVRYSYRGLGGLNQFYIGNSFMFMDRFAIGVNLNYLFGYIEHNKVISVPTDRNTGQTYVRDKNVYGDVMFHIGAQYFQDFKIGSRKYNLTVGGVFYNTSEMSSRRYYILENILSPQNASFRDTVVYTEDEKIISRFPQTIGAGFTIKKMYTQDNTSEWMAGVDYTMTDWSNAGGMFEGYKNTTSLNAGFEYVPQKVSFRDYWKRVHYRIGGYLATSPIYLNGNQLQERGVTFGLGLPFKYSNTTFNLTYEMGVRGTTDNGLIKENYNIIAVNLTFYDFWFFRRKID